MSKTLMAVKRGGLLSGLTKDDKEMMRSVPANRPVKLTVTQQKLRSIEHNGLYWAGLLELAAQYWESSGGLVSPNEEAIAQSFARYLARKTNQDVEGSGMKAAAESFLADMSRRRMNQIGHIETDKRVIKQQIHRWIKHELKLYDVEVTPTGVHKNLRSTNFNAMSQEEFNVFYMGAFGVVWNFVLSRNFACEADAERAVAELMAMGD